MPVCDEFSECKLTGNAASGSKTFLSLSLTTPNCSLSTKEMRGSEAFHRHTQALPSTRCILLWNCYPSPTALIGIDMVAVLGRTPSMQECDSGYQTSDSVAFQIAGGDRTRACGTARKLLRPLSATLRLRKI